MKKTILVTICFCIALLSAMTASAQDVIHRKNGKTIEAKILEIGEAEVKYKLFTQPDGVVFVMDATLIKKIVMANGAVHKFEEGGSIDNPEYYEGQNKSAYKISFLAWTMGYTTFTYEHNLKPGASYEVKLGIIGAGRNESLYNYNNNRKANQRGAYLSLGYKFAHKPDYYSSRQHYSHLLKGGYIRPEVSFGSYGIDSYSYTGSASYTSKRVSTTYGCLMICAGKQWVFDNKFALDFYYGIGTGISSNSNNKNSTTLNGVTYTNESSYTTEYGNTVLPNNLAFSFGLNIGLLGK